MQRMIVGSHQGLDIARRLIERAFYAVEASGAQRLFLASSSKLAPAIGLAESSGFTRVARPARQRHRLEFLQELVALMRSETCSLYNGAQRLRPFLIPVKNPMPACRLLSCLAALLLCACASVGPSTPSAAEAQAFERAAQQDSLRSECDWNVSYAPVAPKDASLAQLQAIATARLAALQLAPAWTLAMPGSEAHAFSDSAQDRAGLQLLLSIVLPAMERYPAGVFARTGLHHVVLVKDLSVDGQRRLAMPAPEIDSVVYADNLLAAMCPSGMELRVHHEYYHFIEYRLFNDFYYRDPAWLALNPPGTAYGQGGATAYGKGFQNLGHPQAGIVSLYAAYGPEEDKAEVFGWMMTPAYARRLEQWTKLDPALLAKRQSLMEVLGRWAGSY
ncbi:MULTISPECIES: hypothetical protein [unclassified Janthinobacterium]|uniref:hypothetical protein n=1 Tax=unclassified Janthinobacterium TaxID=2610881 RepID=UPI0018CAB03B|nr:hypothetical protein [Janthinobacterium sp. CG_23.4]MDH6156688.1 hypothetical protein [Janthinobacterium sp. CG_23.4]